MEALIWDISFPRGKDSSNPLKEDWYPRQELNLRPRD